MTTPIYGLDELVANQSQPHVPVNATLRALEVLASRRVLDKDLATPPGSPAEGDRYIIANGATGAWAGRSMQIAFYSGGWNFIAPATGERWVVADEAAQYEFTFGSPSGWTLVAGSSAVAASSVTYSGTGSGSPTALNVELALNELYALANVVPPYDLGIHVPGQPDANGTILRYIFPRSVILPINLTGSYARSATPAAASTTFTMYKNGSSIGTIVFGSGSPGDVGVFTFSSQQTFAAGDILSIVAPAVQDTTLAGIMITLKGTR